MLITRACSACGFTQCYASPAMADHHHPRHACAPHLGRRELAKRHADRASAEPKRECRHPRAVHTHGTRAAYVRDRCRCGDCTAANTAASNHTYRAKAFGIWQPYVSAAPARAHIESLRSTGIGIDQIAKLAGLTPSHVRGLIYSPGPGKQPFRKVRRDTAQRLLAVPLDDTSRARRSLVDATGTRRRLQALVAIGWTPAWLARELHRSPANLRRSMTSESVTAGTAQLADDLYDRLWDSTPPGRTRQQQQASRAARLTASQRGWLPPLAWDDIDHDPDPAPGPGSDAGLSTPDRGRDLDEIAIERAMAGDTRVYLTHSERVEVVRRLTKQGHSIRAIAELLATSTRTVSRHRRRLNAA